MHYIKSAASESEVFGFHLADNSKLKKKIGDVVFSFFGEDEDKDEDEDEEPTSALPPGSSFPWCHKCREVWQKLPGTTEQDGPGGHNPMSIIIWK